MRNFSIRKIPIQVPCDCATPCEFEHAALPPGPPEYLIDGQVVDFAAWAGVLRADKDALERFLQQDIETFITEQSPAAYEAAEGKPPRKFVVGYDGVVREVLPCECGADVAGTTHSRWCPAWVTA